MVNSTCGWLSLASVSQVPADKTLLEVLEEAGCPDRQLLPCRNLRHVRVGRRSEVSPNTMMMSSATLSASRTKSYCRAFLVPRVHCWSSTSNRSGMPFGETLHGKAVREAESVCSDHAPAPPHADLHQTLSHQIRDTLVRQIVSGELEPGERLVETRVAATFGTSQAPVREALRELDTFGLVEIKPRRGTFVRSFVRDDVARKLCVTCRA